MTGPDETTLRLERLIPSPQVPFALFVEPAQLLQWWAPDGYEPSIDAFDASPGGAGAASCVGWTAAKSRPAASTTSSSRRVASPSPGPGKIRAARGHETEVTVSFEPVPGGTRLVLMQQRFESRPARDNHHRGWSAALDRIAAIAGR